jgi:hypothetical protein
MNKSFAYLLKLLPATFIFLLACDNEIDIAADYETIPVVYGFIDPDVDSNFVRVEKAFLDEAESAFTLAQNPDSIYFDDVVVSITRRNGQSIDLERVDGRDVGLDREEGIFANEPNWLYLLDENQINISQDDVLTLRISRADQELSKATTAMVGGGELIAPFDYTDGDPIAFKEGSLTRISYLLSGNAGMLGVNIYFHFLEENENGDFVPKSLKWQLTDNTVIDENSPRGNFEFDGLGFYQFLSSNIDDSEGRRRVSQFVNIELISVGKELREVRDIQLANQGITGSQELPVFTNVQNGRGIFSSRNIIVQDSVPLSSSTRDSLVNGRFTESLNFLN